MTETPSQNTSTKTIGKRVREVMNTKSLTAQQLSDELAAVNPALNWTPSVVMNLTSGRRRFVTVDEMYALAHVLGLHPVDLLVPGDVPDDEPAELVPGVTTTAGVARDWIGGRGFLSPPESLAELAEAVRWMPKGRASQLARVWWTPEREREQNRAAYRDLYGEPPAPEPGWSTRPPSELREQQEKGE